MICYSPGRSGSLGWPGGAAHPSQLFMAVSLPQITPAGPIQELALRPGVPRQFQRQQWLSHHAAPVPISSAPIAPSDHVTAFSVEDCLVLCPFLSAKAATCWAKVAQVHLDAEWCRAWSRPFKNAAKPSSHLMLEISNMIQGGSVHTGGE